ncbi:hypothetical protein BC938DRAFT_480049 [Jimgerdemannia flammicorona]|uniref:Uncharacterized protein n=1 Tax=Jimgerdemannia flammicorona TaxID=994334 RepID=A0A433QXM6_9FUNG|nr:hypothetical protein BC938DRAFT_480049 [Jimgerdemannia flammicorona]
MVRTTMVARVSDGLPLAASMDDEQVRVCLHSEKSVLPITQGVQRGPETSSIGEQVLTIIYLAWYATNRLIHDTPQHTPTPYNGLGTKKNPSLIPPPPRQKGRSRTFGIQGTSQAHLQAPESEFGTEMLD